MQKSTSKNENEKKENIVQCVVVVRHFKSLSLFDYFFSLLC